MSADPVDALITAVIAREGGFSDRASDAGGPTNWGITIATLRDWRRCPVSREDVINLGQTEARQIYRTNYFTASGFEHVADPELQEFLFDYAVNSGVNAATRALQTVLGVSADGVVGPVTLAALAQRSNAAALFYAVKCERYELLLRFIGSDAEQAANAIGWANRLDPFKEMVT